MTSTPTRRPLYLTLALALIVALSASTATLTTAQDSLIPTDAPVDIHSGTCEDIVAEPAYDGGQISETTTDDMWGDETFMTGIFEDDQLDASGVDFNNDGSLQEDEVITPNGVSTAMGMAEADLGSEVNTDEPYVVAVHASPDAYDTIIACGTIEGGQELEGGQTLVYIQPVGDAANFGYAVLEGSSLNTYLFQPNTEPLEASAASDTPEIVGHPVEIHTGVCEDFTSEPAYDIGDFQQTNVYAEGEQDAGDMEGQIPPEAENLGPVYKLDAQDVDFGGESIFDQGAHVVAVHESAENFGNVIACGQILQVMDGDNAVVFLHPVGGGNHAGYVEMGPEGGDANGFLWELESYDVAASESTPIPQATPAPIETEAPATPTEEATAVIVETEVVPAATATAIAEQEAMGTPADEAMDMGESSVPVEIGGDSASTVSASANTPLLVSNMSGNERSFSVADLGLEATVGGGEQTELLVPEDAEAGTYTYQVMEGDEVVFEGEMTIE